MDAIKKLLEPFNIIGQLLSSKNFWYRGAFFVGGGILLIIGAVMMFVNPSGDLVSSVKGAAKIAAVV